MAVWISEISNPCILKRNILGAQGRENSTAYTVYENLFAVLFVSSRLGWGSWYLLNVWASIVSWMYKLVASCIYAVSLFWIFIIVTKLMKKFSGTNNRVMRKILDFLKFLRQNKAVLLVVIVLISFGLPALLTQFLDIGILTLEADGFQIM